jgi:hypothetical protein
MRSKDKGHSIIFSMPVSYKLLLSTCVSPRAWFQSTAQKNCFVDLRHFTVQVWVDMGCSPSIEERTNFQTVFHDICECQVVHTQLQAVVLRHNYDKSSFADLSWLLFVILDLNSSQNQGAQRAHSCYMWESIYGQIGNEVQRTEVRYRVDWL